MLSKTCEYAIKATIYIAQNSTNEMKIGIKNIAKGIDAPEAFVAKILQTLSKHNFVQSIKGPNGGFYLEDKKLKTKLSEIVKIVDGQRIYKECLLGLKICSEKQPCPLHDEFKKIRQNLIQLFDNTTINEFNNKLDTGKYFLKIK